MSKHPEMSKVLFRVHETDGTARVETLWATPLGDDLYQLDNSPFYAYSVSWKDIVYAPYDPDEQFATFQRVVRKSGHKTIRIIFRESVTEDNDARRVLEQLVSLGCTYEGANKRYICLDVSPEVDFDRVRQFLIQNSVQFEHADPTYTDLFPDDAN